MSLLGVMERSARRRTVQHPSAARRSWDPSWRTIRPEEARTRGFAAPAFAGCALVGVPVFPTTKNEHRRRDPSDPGEDGRFRPARIHTKPELSRQACPPQRTVGSPRNRGRSRPADPELLPTRRRRPCNPVRMKCEWWATSPFEGLARCGAVTVQHGRCRCNNADSRAPCSSPSSSSSSCWHWWVLSVAPRCPIGLPPWGRPTERRRICPSLFRLRSSPEPVASRSSFRDGVSHPRDVEHLLG